MTRRSMTASFLIIWLLSPAVIADTLSNLSAAIDTGDRQALHKIQLYLQEHPNNYQALFLKARALEQQGDRAAASVVYQQLIDKYPNLPEAYNNLAAIYVDQGEFKQAQGLLEKAMYTHPGYAAVYDNLSRIYVEMARSSYGKALQLDAGKPRVALKELKMVSDFTSTPAAATISAKTDLYAAVELSKAAPKSTPVKFEKEEEAIITTLQGWAAAWSEQASDVYFVFYANDFAPAGLTRRSWEQERRLRLKKPEWIQIGLSNFKVKRLSGSEARVELVQDYRASNYQDKTKKILRMRQTPDGWRIVAEKSIARIN